MVFIALPRKDASTRLPLLSVYIPQFKSKGQWNLEARMWIFWRKTGKLSAGEQFFPKIFVQQRFLEEFRLALRRGGRFGLERQAKGERR
ncbi:MAG: hypothetical protein ACLQHM_13050, partial [Limisphaerales bacterium]